MIGPLDAGPIRRNLRASGRRYALVHRRDDALPSGREMPFPLARLAGPFFIGAGALHFVKPKPYRAIMPPYIPAPDAMVALSGVAEIAGGVGLLAARSRRLAGWWLVATLVAVFPANVHMAVNPERFERGVPGGRTGLYVRLPLQALLIAWVLRAAA
jgi:uncharacterized membrane protein